MPDGEELIRDIWSRWNGGEREPKPGEFDSDVAIHSVLAGKVFRGPEGLGEWIAEIDEQFQAWQLGIDEVRKVGPDSFVVHGSISARGRQSGVDLNEPASWIVRVTGGRIAEIVNFIGASARSDAEAAAE